MFKRIFLCTISTSVSMCLFSKYTTHKVKKRCPLKVFLAGWYQTLPLGSKIPFLLWYRHSPKLLIQTLWAERITLWAFIIACQGHISCVIDIFEFYNGCLKFCLIFFTNLTILANLAILKNLVILVNMVIYVNMVMLVNHVILLNLVFCWWFWWFLIKCDSGEFRIILFNLVILVFLIISGNLLIQVNLVKIVILVIMGILIVLVNSGDSCKMGYTGNSQESDYF